MLPVFRDNHYISKDVVTLASNEHHPSCYIKERVSFSGIVIKHYVILYEAIAFANYAIEYVCRINNLFHYRGREARGAPEMKGEWMYDTLKRALDKK